MKRARAVFTMQRDEDVFLPIWLKYYSQYFDEDSIYVLDHSSTNGIIERLSSLYQFHYVRYDREEYADLQWHKEIVEEWQRKLLQGHSCVLFTDPDEIIFAQEGLDKYIEHMETPSVRSAGFVIVHRPELEPPMDLSKTVLSQRSWCDLSTGKQLLSRAPLRWSPGFHGADPEGRIDPSLFFVHLHKMDYGVCKTKNERVAGYKWNKQAFAKRRGWQTRCLGEEFEKFFRWTEGPGLVSIPAAVKASDAF